MMSLLTRIKHWMSLLTRIKHWFLEPERPANVASYCAALQSVVVSVSIIVGGVWTAHEFSATRKASNAEIEYRHKLESEVAMHIRLNARQLELGKKNERVLIIDAILKNEGGQSVVMDFKQPPIYVINLQRDHSGHEMAAMESTAARLYRHSMDKNNNIDTNAVDAQTIPPRCEKILTFIVWVDKPGLYEVQFSTPMGIRSGKVIKGIVQEEISTDPGEQSATWAQNTYIFIK